MIVSSSKYASKEVDVVRGRVVLFLLRELGEELRGKPAGRLPLLHEGIGLQLLQQSGRGEVFRAGEGLGASPEKQSFRVVNIRV